MSELKRSNSKLTKKTNSLSKKSSKLNKSSSERLGYKKITAKQDYNHLITANLYKNHVVDEREVNKLDKEIYDFIFKNKPLYFSHLEKGFKKADKPLDRILNDNSPELSYQRRRNEFKKTVHWGQMKLHLSEIEFLNLIYKEYNNQNCPEKQIYFIYAGSAPGHHIAFLHSLFPDIKFELYDPNPFKIDNNDYINIHTGDPNGFFTNQTAKYWKAKNHPDKFIVFCSDIRTEPATPENVKQNMDMQLNWWTIMNPEMSMFKFRLPWTDEKSQKNDYTEYPNGDIYIQVYPGHTSTETRLIVKKNAEMKKYYHAKYENQMYYHNKITRILYYDNILGELSIEKDGLCNCYDCVSFINIIMQYLEIIHEQKNINKNDLFKLIISNIKSINHRDSIFSKTVDNFNNMIMALLSEIYIKCNKKICNICKIDRYKEQNRSIAKHGKTILVVDD
jgi:hypothetical protein